MSEVYLAEDSKKGSGMANAAMGSVPLKEVFMVTQNEGCTQSSLTQTYCIHSTSHTFYILQMDCINVQSFPSVSKLFPLCAE